MKEERANRPLISQGEDGFEVMRRLYASLILPITVLAAAGLAKEPLQFSERDPYKVEAAEMEMVKTAEGGITYLRGGVVITHGPTVITGREGVVYEARNEAVLRGDVEIVDGSTTLTAKEASYSKNGNLAVLRNGVKVVDGVQTIEADTITYNRKTGVAVARGSVKITDEAEDVRVMGEEGSYDFNNSYGAMYRSPHFTTFGEGDTVSITSDTMELFRQEGRSVARGNVLISQGSLRGRCQEATYFEEDKRVILTGEPRVDQETNWLRGNKIELRFQKGKLASMVVTDGGKGVYRLENEESNRIEGELIRVSFEEGEAQRIIVEGGAKGTYQFKEEEED